MCLFTLGPRICSHAPHTPGRHGSGVLESWGKVSTTWFKLWTGLLALKIQLESKTRHSRQLCLLWKQKDNALLLQTWHGTPWWCEHWAWVMLCVRGYLGSKLWDSRLFVMPASSSQSHVPAPATSTIIHAHYFILHDQISYLPTATKLVPAVGLSPRKRD